MCKQDVIKYLNVMLKDTRVVLKRRRSSIDDRY